MGAKQSHHNTVTKADHTTVKKKQSSLPYAAVKKKESSSLHKSRLKYLSEILGASDSHLAPHDANGDQTKETSDQTELGGIVEENLETGSSGSSEEDVQYIDVALVESKDRDVDEVVEEDVMIAAEAPMLKEERALRGLNQKGAGTTRIKKGKLPVGLLAYLSVY